MAFRTCPITCEHVLKFADTCRYVPARAGKHGPTHAKFHVARADTAKHVPTCPNTRLTMVSHVPTLANAYGHVRLSRHVPARAAFMRMCRHVPKRAECVPNE